MARCYHWTQLAKRTWNGDYPLCLDNITAVSYINHRGGTESKVLCIVITICSWCTERDIILQLERLPSQLISQADHESKAVRDRCDWKLKQLVFFQIQAVRGPLEIDLFASRLTRQLPRFYSWRLDPEADATDAFMQNWATCRGFANLRGAWYIVV